MVVEKIEEPYLGRLRIDSGVKLRAYERKNCEVQRVGRYPG